MIFDLQDCAARARTAEPAPTRTDSLAPSDYRPIPLGTTTERQVDRHEISTNRFVQCAPESAPHPSGRHPLPLGGVEWGEGAVISRTSGLRNCDNRYRASNGNALRLLGSTPRGVPVSSDAEPIHDEDFLLRLYFRDIQREPRLTLREESQVAIRARSGDTAACHRLALANLRLAVHIASDYRNSGLPLADLINEGNLGLLHAAALFDPTQGVGFGHYAAAWIRQRMRRALSSQAWPLRLPAAFAWHRSRVQRAEEYLHIALGRAPDENEVAVASGLPLPTVRRLRATGTLYFISLQKSPSDGESGSRLADTLADESALAPDREAARRSDREFVERLLGTLKPRERQVLRLHFGLDDRGPRTFGEIGRALGCVRQRIQRIESDALVKLRQRARMLEFKPPPGGWSALITGTPAEP
jgi:RNA polymerase primary sigma factor